MVKTKLGTPRIGIPNTGKGIFITVSLCTDHVVSTTYGKLTYDSLYARIFRRSAVNEEVALAVPVKRFLKGVWNWTLRYQMIV